MNFLVLLPMVVLAIPIIPAFIEFFGRKDRGPREFPEQNIYEENPDIDDSAPIMERIREAARVKVATKDILRVAGDASIPDGTEIQKNMVVQGYLRIGGNCRIRGSVKALGGVEIGESSVIEGHVLSDRKVIVGRKAKVDGIVDSLEDITLEEGAEVGAVSTEKTVKIRPGARINKKVSSGASIVTLPPEAHPATITPVVPQVPRFRPTSPSSIRVTEPGEVREIESEMDQLFKSLEDRIPSLESFRAPPIDESTLKDLTLKEIEIYKLATSRRDIYEIGLRLLIDPVEVQKIINSLVERGHLDKGFKSATIEEAEKPEHVVQESPHEARPLEVGREKPIREELPIDEVFESLLKSKLSVRFRKELERVNGKPETDVSSSSNDMKNPVRKVENNRRLTNTADMGSLGRESESVDKSTCRKIMKSLPSRQIVVMPLLMLVSLLLAEIAFYNASMFGFLDQLLPPIFRMWMILSIVALTLGVVSLVHILKYQMREGSNTLRRGSQ